ncbi:MAG: hypothetical protein IPI46_08045 [Bacteroidetes bacterium]|nr:hypothetical protein [Bacteroidota bacterium]
MYLAIDDMQTLDIVIKRFNKQDLLPDNLKGITVFIIYEPHTKRDDELFTFFTKSISNDD